MNADRLEDTMFRATDGLHPPVDRLVAGSLQRAGRLRRRRRITRGVAAGSAACVVGAAALLAPSVVPIQHPRTGPGTTVDAGAGPARDGSRIASVPAQAPPGSVHQLDVSADAMAQMLAKLVPPGSKTSLRNWSGSDFQAGSLIYDDGHGKGLVSVLVEQVKAEHVCGLVPKSRSHAWAHASKKRAASGASCAPVGKAAKAKARQSKSASHPGTVSVMKDSPEYPGDNPGGVVSNIVSWYIGGYQVEVEAYNAPAEKGSATTRPHPILSVNQLTRIAKSPVWLR